MENVRYPQLKVFEAPRASNDKVQNVLVVCTDAGSLPSLAIWDNPKKPTDFTTGRGFHFCQFTAKSDAEIQEGLDEITNALSEFVEQQAQKEVGIKGRNLRVTARPTPPTAT